MSVLVSKFVIVLSLVFVGLIAGGTVSVASDEAEAPAGGSAETVSGAEFDKLQAQLVKQRIQSDTPKTGTFAPRAGASCGRYYSGVATPFAWKTTHAKDCNIAGHSGYKKPYDWYVPSFSSGSACAQGKGYNNSGITWVSLGCGKSGKGKAPWGNRLSYPSYKAKSLAAPLMTPTQWS